MNQQTSSERSRFDRLTALLAQDPSNSLLIADTADAALAAGELAEAQALVDRGIEREGETRAWRFRSASVLIAQRRLDEAAALLEGLRAEAGRVLGVDHNLAYVAFLQGDHAKCEQLLRPWTSQDLLEDVAQALWLRCLHHLDRLDEAWAYANSKRLGTSAAGVASLIGIDLGAIREADAFASAALERDPGHVEATLTRASIAAARGEHDKAQRMLQPLAVLHPHQLRIASTLAWVHILSGRLPAARELFEHLVQADPQSADAHAGMAIVAALLEDTEPASRHASRALELDPRHPVAEAARAILRGDAQALQQLMQRGDWMGRRPGR